MDYAVYALPLTVGPLLWWGLVAATGEDEPWDNDVYWPMMVGVSLLLGFALGASRLPHIPTRVPLVGFVIAALLFSTHIISALVTTPEPTNASLFPLLIVLWLPVITIFAGAAATAGVLLYRWRDAATPRAGS